MSEEHVIDIARVLPSGPAGTLTKTEADAILELAYLATAADEELVDEEAVTLRVLAEHLRALSTGPDANVRMTSRELNEYLDAFTSNLDHKTLEERVVELASALKRSLATETAYKVSFAMSMTDFATSDDETEFDDMVVEALGITDEQADELAAEVYEALGIDEDDEFEDEDEESFDDDEDDIDDDEEEEEEDEE